MKVLLIFIFILLACSHNLPNKRYPEHWWKPVSKKELAWWEIGPQAANKGEVILSKRNELGLLSNFADTPFTFEGKKYATLEAFWQSMKYPDPFLKNDPRNKVNTWPNERSKVEKFSGFAAKSAGDLASTIMKKLKIDWVSYKGKKMKYWTSQKGEHYLLIRRAMLAKLAQNYKVKEVLLSTGDLKLLPDHHTKKTDPPAWKYYQIWMEIRDELKKSQ